MTETVASGIARRVVAGDGDAPSHPVADTVRLDYEARFLRRRRIRTDTGVDVLVDLPEARQLADGDRLVLEDGRAVRVHAADEALAEIRPRNAEDLARLAWHVGNRHVPCEIRAGALRIRRDHVIEAMLARLGAEVVPVEAPFDPERGAYGNARTFGHEHGHDHAHGRLHDHDHAR